MNYFLKKIVLFLQQKTEELCIEANAKYMQLGKHSKIYPETKIYNFPKNSSNILVGDNTHIRGELLVFNYGGLISIGDNSFIGENTRIWSGEKISIGNNVLISHNCNIIDSNTHESDMNERAEGFKKLIAKGQPTEKGNIQTKSITIEDNVWISFNVTILKGVRIGKGSIIGANAIVTKDVPAYTRLIPFLENKIELLSDAIR